MVRGMHQRLARARAQGDQFGQIDAGDAIGAPDPIFSGVHAWAADGHRQGA
jgi:hypothetical protein